MAPNDYFYFFVVLENEKKWRVDSVHLTRSSLHAVLSILPQFEHKFHLAVCSDHSTCCGGADGGGDDGGDGGHGDGGDGDGGWSGAVHQQQLQIQALR